MEHFISRDNLQRPILRMKGIYKTFPGVRALENVDFELFPGEICGLLGENGAGKTTLMNILGGVFSADEGCIFLDDREVFIRNTKIAGTLGISFIHQELSLFKNIDIATNIYIQHLPKHFGLLNVRKLRKDSREILDRVNLSHCRAEQRVSELKIGEQQLVEIGRALVQKTKILILDEPTSSLSNSEIEVFFNIVRYLKEQGVAVVFITHRMDEIYSICDSIVILRDGKKILHSEIGEISRVDVVKNMLGREMKEQYAHNVRHKHGEPLLSVKRLSIRDKLSNVSFEVYRGELVGLYGLLGSGRSEVLRSVFGLGVYDTGEISYKGSKIRFSNPKEAIENNIAMVTEDRHKEGLVLGKSVAFNITLASLRSIKKGLLTSIHTEESIAKHWVSELNVATSSIHKLVLHLSGGNQQKVVLAKWLETRPDLLLLDEPTRGVDIGAKREIYSIIDDLLKEGVGVLMVSSEIPEILGLCDHVVVLKEGRVVSDFTKLEDLTSENLLTSAMGGVV
jgi:ABC-type sugar transport system ATPase subunit